MGAFEDLDRNFDDLKEKAREKSRDLKEDLNE
jgi:hypothetical protein